MDSGETWLMPLLKIHDFLVQTQTPENKCLYREHKRKDGKIWLKSDGSGISRGPYKFETRKRILAMVLEAQKEVNAKKPELKLQLILPEELSEIRRLWRVNESDWEDSLPRIYRETMGSDLDWVRDDITFSITEKNLLSDIAAKHNVPPVVPMRLMDIALQSKGMSKRATIYKKINRILSEDWRSEEEFLNDLEKEKTTGVQ
jgi:DNA sulfur modification protein DndC